MALLKRYIPPRSKVSRGRVVIAHTPLLDPQMFAVKAALEDAGIEVWDDGNVPFEALGTVIDHQLSLSGALLVLVGKRGLSSHKSSEIKLAQERGIPIFPLLVGGAGYHELPNELSRYQALLLSPEPGPHELASVAGTVVSMLAQRMVPAPAINPNDPQKGQWGGQASANGRLLSADVTALEDPYCTVHLRVSAPGSALAGSVVFHLHPSFRAPIREVPVVDGIAALDLVAWGAFTVGASVDGGKTRLELDLAMDPRFPAGFRSR